MLLQNFKFSDFFSNTTYAVLIAGVLLTLWLTFGKKSRIPNTDLIQAAQNKDLEAFKRELAKRKVDINQINLNRHTPLIVATMNFGTKYLIEELIEKGAWQNWQDIQGNTALHYAITRKKNALVKIFVDNKADLSLKNEEGKTAIDIATEKGLADILEILNQSTS